VCVRVCVCACGVCEIIVFKLFPIFLWKLLNVRSHITLHKIHKSQDSAVMLTLI